MSEMDAVYRLHSVANNLERVIYLVDAILNGEVRLTTDPALGDPTNQIWDVESNLLKFLSSELPAISALARGELVREVKHYKGVEYYHVS